MYKLMVKQPLCTRMVTLTVVSAFRIVDKVRERTHMPMVTSMRALGIRINQYMVIKVYARMQMEVSITVSGVVVCLVPQVVKGAWYTLLREKCTEVAGHKQQEMHPVAAVAKVPFSLQMDVNMLESGLKISVLIRRMAA